MKHRILEAVSGDPHGIPYDKILERLALRKDEREEFHTAWRSLTDQGRLIRTSRGFKAGVSGFGRGGFQ